MPDCFIIMPISTPSDAEPLYNDDSDHFLHVLDHLFIPAIKKAGLTAIPPVAEGGELIHARIIENLERADLVLCDMSILNPNVFFEFGIRTALDKPVCLVRDDMTKRVPFDTGIINFHTYESSLATWKLEAEVESLSIHIEKSAPDGQVSNSLWKYFGISSRAKPTEGGDGAIDKLDFLTIQVEAMRKQIAITQQPEVALATDFGLKNFGLLVHGERVKQGISRQEIANMVDVSPKTFFKIERGQFRPSSNLAARICMALALPASKIIEEFRLEDDVEE